MPSEHARLAALYQGRTDVWGAVHGEQVKRPLTLDDWDDHIFGSGSVGVYPLVWMDPYDVEYGWYVKWCGVDIDEGYDRGLPIAKNLHTALKYLGVQSWMEKSKGKGFHVLVFLQDWVWAATARQAMMTACQVVDYNPKEIYPKQTELAEGQAGNYLNAAYARKWANENKRVVIDSRTHIIYSLSQFLEAAERSLTPATVIAEVAALYKQPPPPKPVQWSVSSGVGQRSPKGVALKMIEEGPYPSVHTGRVDRSAALVRMANLLHDDHFTPSEALHWVQVFDQRPDMQKYTERRDADDRYREIVERAYG